MEEIVKDAKFNGKNVKIRVCASADQIEDVKNSIKELGDVANNFTREPATMRVDTINVLLPVYTVMKSTRADIKPYAVAVYAQLDKSKNLLGFGSVALSSLNRARYFYTNKVPTEFNIKSYPKSQYGLPLTNEINERLDTYLEKLCENFTQLQATGEKAVSINPNFIEDPETKRNRMIFYTTDEQGNAVRCREVERTLFAPVTTLKLTENDKNALKDLAVKWLGK